MADAAPIVQHPMRAARISRVGECRYIAVASPAAIHQPALEPSQGAASPFADSTACAGVVCQLCTSRLIASIGPIAITVINRVLAVFIVSAFWSGHMVYGRFAGSSPLVRGFVDREPVTRIESGSSPPVREKCAAGAPGPPGPRVHPRARGAASRACRCLRQHSGSSPLLRGSCGRGFLLSAVLGSAPRVRGSQLADGPAENRVGFIPADAGR